MTWIPISGIVPQATEDGNQAIGFVLKFYEVGTTTPLAVSTNSSGTPTTTDFLLDVEGYTTLSGNRVVPHVETDYKIILYLNQADADANNTGSAVYSADDLLGTTAAPGSIGLNELYTIPDGNIIIGGTAVNANFPLSGDVTMSNTGVVTIGNGVIEQSMLAPSVTANFAIIKNTIEGLNLSNNTTDADHDLDIAAGICTDSTGVSYIDVPANTISIDQNIGTGNGGFPSGLTLTADTWYRVLICSKDDGVDPVTVFDTDASAAFAISDLGVEYTLFRRIGWIRSDASQNITAFEQEEGVFEWLVQVQDYNQLGATGSRSAITLTVPVLTTGILTVSAQDNGFSGAGRNYHYLTRTSQADVAPSDIFSQLSSFDNSNESYSQSISINMKADSSSQIHERATAPDATVIVNTRGWIDTRIN